MLTRFLIVFLSLATVFSYGQQNNFAIRNGANTFTGPQNFNSSIFFGLNNTTYTVGHVPDTTAQSAVTAACSVGQIREVEVPAGVAIGVNLALLSGCTNVYITDKRAFIPTYGTWGSGIYTFTPAGGGGVGAVSSVFGRTGAVVAVTNDYSFSQISGTIGPAQLPIATTSLLGGVKVDGTTITISGGIISASGGGGSGNTTSTSLTANSLPKANGANSIVNSGLTDDGSTLDYQGNAVFGPVNARTSAAQVLISGSGAQTFEIQGVDPTNARVAFTLASRLGGTGTSDYEIGSDIALNGTKDLYIFRYADSTVVLDCKLSPNACQFGVAVTSSSFNGVALSTGGSSTTFLNGTGTYTTPSGGSGTVTHTGGLTANSLMLGNGTADSKVDTVATSDGNGNLILAGLTVNGPGGAGGGAAYTEGTAPTGASGVDDIWADSTSHRLNMLNNNGQAQPLVGVIATGTLALGTSAIASGACATATATATNTASTDSIIWNPNASIKAVTGYVPATTGGLSIAVYPTTNTVNVDVCNWSNASITPGAVTLNWKVVR